MTNIVYNILTLKCAVDVLQSKNITALAINTLKSSLFKLTKIFGQYVKYVVVPLCYKKVPFLIKFLVLFLLTFQLKGCTFYRAPSTPKLCT